MPNDYAWATFEDFDGDTQTTSIPGIALADDVDEPTWSARVAALQLAITAISIGRRRAHGRRITDNQQLPGSASSPIAQKSVQAMVVMKDAVTGGQYTERIPMPNLGMVADGDGDDAWLTDGELTILNPLHNNYQALKTTMEDFWRSPNENAGTLQKVYIEE